MESLHNDCAPGSHKTDSAVRRVQSVGYALHTPLRKIRTITYVQHFICVMLTQCYDAVTERYTH